MKRLAFYLSAVLLIGSAFITRPAFAQTQTPPAGPTGEISGTIINRNTGAVVAEKLEVMLHIVDQDYVEKGMLHGESQPDGTFLFADVPFDPNLQYAVMAIYEGVTYFSDTVAADMKSMRVELDAPVYESTADLSSVQADQVHVLFNIAEDGLETKEIYILSNTGDRTVKDVYKLDGDKAAALKFPLPSDADYIFFKPDDQDRFIKFNGGFADIYPLLPGIQSAQIMVNYVVPYSGGRTYSYTAPLNIVTMNFLVPEQENVAVQGSGLGGPERMTLQDGTAYLVYSYSNLKAGQTISISIGESGKSQTKSENTTVPFAIGAAVLGLVVIGAGVWWWRKSDSDEDESDEGPEDETDFDQVINEIAQLDQAHEQGEIDEDKYRGQRQSLRKKAKALLARNENEK
ncbi:MAG: hypothetical protein HY258_13550 [Chloroflexi bacterium]|nr:hypothetical protein [Chloroflexota bacterium]